METQSSLANQFQEKPSSLVGIRLREERERIGITQADAALLVGVSREMWGRYERGAMPSSEVLLRAQGHGFDVNYILGGARVLSEATLVNEERTLIERYRAVDGAGKAAILRATENEYRVQRAD